MWHLLVTFWPHIVAAVTIVVMVTASCHAVLHKRDSRSAIGWVGLIWLVPLLGGVLYVLLGINRIRRRAQTLRRPGTAPDFSREESLVNPAVQKVLATHPHIREQMRLVGDCTRRRLLEGNKVDPLTDPETAYPVMLKAIDEAQHTITLSTYIFNRDPTGHQFAEALGRAVARGVQVRVLIDSIGSRYTFPSILPTLRRLRVPVARFMPTLVPSWFAYANLRSHRKIMVVDGRIGFTGGMNIRDPAQVQVQGVPSMHDLHFRFEGPVVTHLQQVFAEDWAFSTREMLEPDMWFPSQQPDGDVLARGVSIGPDEDWDKLRLVLLGALATAESRVRILTPYFIPDGALIMALNVAAMRGVEVDIILPEHNNLKTVKWAATAQYWQILGHGCRLWMTTGPFDHTKLMLVDDIWSFVGSANWDARSLRLNFEFNVECYDAQLAESLEALIQSKLKGAKQITLAQVDSRPLWKRLRDGVARLFAPYL